LNKSNKGHLDLINKPMDRDWDVILIQEPHITHTGLIRAPLNFLTIYPQDHYKPNHTTVRSVIFINTNILSSSWQELVVPGTMDVTGVQPNNGGRLLSIFNVYFNCMNMATMKKFRHHLARERPTLH
ncbi:hypothetical protein HYPSUDRAFT_121668, partial [Hypholoma sublateritium FD-334 SS-4]